MNDLTRQVGHNVTLLTPRDVRLFQKLNAAGWLTSRQIRDYFFCGKSTNAVCKRLRKLSAGGYIASARTSSTESGLYRLSGGGRLALVEQTRCGESNVIIPNQLPRKLNHFIGINELRLRFETGMQGSPAQLLFFFSERELGRYAVEGGITADPIVRLARAHGIIPDAIARIKTQPSQLPVNLFIEYDEGTEHATFFGRTKVRQYSNLFSKERGQLDRGRVLTFARSIKRVISLMRQTLREHARADLFYFALIEKLSGSWLESEIFLDPHDFFIPVRQANRTEIVEKEIGARLPKHTLLNLVTASPCGVSSRGERIAALTLSESGGYA
jgi:hypothetical protein